MQSSPSSSVGGPSPGRGLSHAERRDDGGVVGEADAAPVAPRDLAALGVEPRAAARRTSRPRASRWSIASAAVGARQAERARSASNASGAVSRPAGSGRRRTRADRSPAHSSRQLRGTHAPRARPRDRRGSPWRGGSPPPDGRRPAAPPARAASAGVRAARASVCRSTSRMRPGARTSSWFEPPSPEAMQVGVDRGGQAARERRPWLREVSAIAPLAPARRASGRKPARRRLLEERDVPVPARRGVRRTRGAASG